MQQTVQYLTRIKKISPKFMRLPLNYHTCKESCLNILHEPKNALPKYITAPFEVLFTCKLMHSDASLQGPPEIAK